jgi:hypothetical protein
MRTCSRFFAVDGKHTARDAGSAAARPLFGKAPEDRPVFFKTRAQSHIEKSALLTRGDRRHSALPARFGRARPARPPSIRRSAPRLRLSPKRCASVPAFSVIKKSPSGSGSTAHGRSNPFASTVTSKAASDFTAQVRVCPGKAGFCSGALAVLVSTGAHCGVEAEVLAVSRAACAQAVPAVINKAVKTNTI